MQDDFSTTLHEGELSQQEKYINPYTDFACYSELERRQYEQRRKEYWDYFSTMETAEKNGYKRGLTKNYTPCYTSKKRLHAACCARTLPAR